MSMRDDFLFILILACIEARKDNINKTFIYSYTSGYCLPGNFMHFIDRIELRSYH